MWDQPGSTRGQIARNSLWLLNLVKRTPDSKIRLLGSKVMWGQLEVKLLKMPYRNALNVAYATLEHMMLIGALVLLLWGGNFMQTYSKVLKFQLAKNYAKRETFEKSSKRIVFVFFFFFFRETPNTYQ